ncbi:MAG: septum site-determining protein MinC [Clostridia bacterium]|nr:septum site-determining protein MinC [Clostridia bacterium]
MEPVILKGNREGIVVHLDCNLDLQVLAEKIIEKFTAAEAFLGSERKVVINTGDVVLDEGQAQYLKNVFSSLGVEVRKIISEIDKKENVFSATQETAEMLDMINSDQFLAAGPTLIIRKNLRSGQRIFHEGSIIILGDVNPGAEVIATGHILVIGTLRGIAHAGAKGDPGAIVFANRLQPTQLRIGSFISRAPDNEEVVPVEPEIAYIKNDMVIIEKYLQKK